MTEEPRDVPPHTDTPGPSDAAGRTGGGVDAGARAGAGARADAGGGPGGGSDAGSGGAGAGSGGGSGAGSGGPGAGSGGGLGSGGSGSGGSGAASAGAGGPVGGGAAEAKETGKPRLRRSRTHKVAGGVCGGLGRYFDLDPVIFRVPLVVLSVVGGLGLVFYGFAWLLIPVEGEKENEGRRLLSGRVEGPSLSAILVALVGCGLFLASLGSRSVPFSVMLIGAVAGAAYWSQHRRQAEAAGAEGAQVDPTLAHAVADAPPETQAPPAPSAPSWWREPLTKEAGAVKDGTPAPGGYLWGPADALPYAAVPRPQYAAEPSGTPGKPARERGSGGGPLGGLVFLLAVLAGGIATAAAWQGNPLGTTLTIGLSCALAVFGLGLVVSAFVGRTGAGTVVCVVLTAGLLAGAAAMPSDISTHFRDMRWVPASAQEVEPRYDLGSGTGEIDLREVEMRKDRPVRTASRIGAGRLKVVVPADAKVEVDAQVGLGGMRFPRGLDADGDVVFDWSGGFGDDGPGQHRTLTLRPFDGGTAKGTVHLKLSVGIGDLEIVRELPSGERSDHGDPPPEPGAERPDGKERPERPATPQEETAR